MQSPQFFLRYILSANLFFMREFLIFKFCPVFKPNIDPRAIVFFGRLIRRAAPLFIPSESREAPQNRGASLNLFQASDGREPLNCSRAKVARRHKKRRKELELILGKRSKRGLEPQVD
jgi:hypothetical protein